MSWYLKCKDSKSQLIESPRKEENWSEDKPEATEEPTKSKDKNRSKYTRRADEQTLRLGEQTKTNI